MTAHVLKWPAATSITVRQSPSPQVTPHVSVVAAGHAPMEQEAAAVFVVPVQLCPRHSTVGYTHAVRSTPSHVPAQTVSVPVHAVRVPCGAPVTDAQVPI